MFICIYTQPHTHTNSQIWWYLWMRAASYIPTYISMTMLTYFLIFHIMSMKKYVLVCMAVYVYDMYVCIYICFFVYYLPITIYDYVCIDILSFLFCFCIYLKKKRKIPIKRILDHTHTCVLFSNLFLLCNVMMLHYLCRYGIQWRIESGHEIIRA